LRVLSDPKIWHLENTGADKRSNGRNGDVGRFAAPQPVLFAHTVPIPIPIPIHPILFHTMPILSPFVFARSRLFLFILDFSLFVILSSIPFRSFLIAGYGFKRLRAGEICFKSSSTCLTTTTIWSEVLGLFRKLQVTNLWGLGRGFIVHMPDKIRLSLCFEKS